MKLVFLSWNTSYEVCSFFCGPKRVFASRAFVMLCAFDRFCGDIEICLNDLAFARRESARIASPRRARCATRRAAPASTATTTAAGGASAPSAASASTTSRPLSPPTTSPSATEDASSCVTREPRHPAPRPASPCPVPKGSVDPVDTARDEQPVRPPARRFF